MKKIQWIIGVISLAGTLFAADPRIEQGKTLLASGKHKEAIDEFRAILAANPDNALAAEAYYGAAEAYVKMGNYSRAIANFRLAYQKQPNMSAAYEGIAAVYNLLGDKAAAEAELAKDPKNKVETAEPAKENASEVVQAPAIAEESETKEKVSEPSQAKVEVKKEEPVSEKVEAKKEEPVAKEVAMAQETKSEPKSEVKSGSGFTYDGPMFVKGRTLFDEKKYADAAQVWREVLRQQPGNPGAYYFAGAGRYELGELDKAEFNLKRAFDYPELGYNAHFYLSLIYKKQNKKSAEIAELKEYIRLTPSANGKEQAKKRLSELENGTKEQAKVQEEPKEVAKQVAPEPKQEVKEIEKEKVQEPKKEETVVAEKAEKSSEPAKENIKQNVATNETLPLTIESANSLFKKKELSKALSYYKDLLENGLSEDDKAFVLLQMGNIYRERRDFRLAVSRYREIVENYSESFWAAEAERAWKDAVWLETHIAEIPRK